MDLSGLGTLLTGAGAAAASLYAIFKDVRKTNRRDSGSAGSHADEDGPEAVAELARRYLAEHHGNGDGPTPV